MIINFKHKGWKKTLWFFLPLLFFSCATQQQFNSLDIRISQLESQVYRLNKKMNTKIDSQTRSIRVNLADLQANFDSIRDDINSLRGYSQENRMMLKRIIESDLSKIDQINQQLSQLSQRISDIEGQLRQIQDYLGFEENQSQNQSLENLNQRLQKETSTSKTDLYNQAFSFYKQGRYEDAILEFKKFLKKYPKSNLSDNAWFWIGECYMGLKNYEKAILAYHEVVKRYPKGNKVPSAMLRQAQAFAKIKDKTSARLILKRLIKKFPKSNEAKIAKKILRRR